MTSRLTHGLASALLLSFGAATLGLALPLYSFIDVNRLFMATDRSGLLLLVLAFHAAPTAALLAVDRLLAISGKAKRLQRIFWTAVFSLVLLVLLREGHLYMLRGETFLLPAAAKLGIILSASAAVLAICLLAYQGVRLWFLYMSPAAALMAVMLAFQMGLLGGESSVSEGSSAPSPPAAQPGPVVIILFDGLNYDVLLDNGDIDARRYPSFAALAGDGAWFTNASTNYVSTFYSIPSLLTGELIKDEAWLSSDIPVRGFETKNLLSMLGRQYRVNVYQEHFNHCFADVGKCTIRRADSSLSYVGMTAGFLVMRWVPKVIREPLRLRELVGRLQQSTTDHVERFLADINASASPGSLYYYHFSVPHAPYARDENGERHSRGNTKFEGRADFALVYENYRRQVGFADSILGRVISKLKSEGLYDEAVVVVTSDHGIRPERAAMPSGFPKELSDLIPHIPLIIKAPGLEPQVVSAEYQHLDFVPTVLDVLGIPATADFPGRSAFASAAPERETLMFTKGLFGLDETYTRDGETGTWSMASP